MGIRTFLKRLKFTFLKTSAFLFPDIRRKVNTGEVELKTKTVEKWIEDGSLKAVSSSLLSGYMKWREHYYEGPEYCGDRTEEIPVVIEIDESNTVLDVVIKYENRREVGGEYSFESGTFGEDFWSSDFETTGVTDEIPSIGSELQLRVDDRHGYLN
jgi:hypothetical protein